MANFKKDKRRKITISRMAQININMRLGLIFAFALWHSMWKRASDFSWTFDSWTSRGSDKKMFKRITVEVECAARSTQRPEKIETRSIRALYFFDKSALHIGILNDVKHHYHTLTKLRQACLAEPRRLYEARKMLGSGNISPRKEKKELV